MRKLLIIIIVLAFALPLSAQYQAEHRQMKSPRPLAVGIKVGANLPSYRYASKDLNLLGRKENGMDSLWTQRVRMAYGVQVEIPLDEDFIFTPEVTYLNRGDRRYYKNIPTGNYLTYEARVHYLDLRLPITYVFPLKSPVQPYLFAGVDAGMVLPYLPLGNNQGLNLSGTISQEETVEVNQSNMAPFDVSAFAGLGVRCTMNFGSFSLVAKLEADYNYGFLNTYSKQEIASQVPAANLGVGGTHYIVDSRKNRGIEAFFTLLLPLRFMNDACSNWADGVYPIRSKGHRGF